MTTKKKGDVLVEMRDIRIDGFSDERWHEIIKGVDLTLRRGEVMGLIGESGAGKSTIARNLLEEDKGFELSISYTTRQRRGSCWKKPDGQIPTTTVLSIR